jgi:hypothetical protein
MNDEQKKGGFHLYGRKAYSQPLNYIHTISAPTVHSLPAPEGDEWIEVIAFPASAVIRVIPRETAQSTAKLDESSY